MKKSVLKEVIHNIVRQKLLEAKGASQEFGYIISGEGEEDPVLQLNGFGNMLASQWKAKIARQMKEVLGMVEKGDWHNAAYLLREGSVMYNSIQMMDEVLTPEDMKEGIDTNFIDTENPMGNTQPSDDRVDPASHRENEALAKLQAEDASLTNDIQVLQSKIIKRETPVRRQNAQDRQKIEQLETRRGNVSKKIENLKKNLG